MSEIENSGRKHDSENFIQELMDAAKGMIECGNEVNKATEKIIKSCESNGTRGADHKSLLLNKIADLKRLAELYMSVSEKYLNAAVKLTGGVSVDEVMAELRSYNVSLNDQMISEKKCYEQVLRTLRS